MGGGICERAERYIEGARRALEGLRGALGGDYARLLDAASRYLDDAEYYVGQGDCETGLVAASYAEGLIDALKYLGVVEPEWPSGAIEKPRVFVAGTFDLIHPGHVDLLRFASKYGRVYAVVARDSTVERVKRKKPILDEEARLENIEAIRYVYEARLGDEEDMLRPVEEVDPDIIVLGPDQPFDEEELASMVEERIGRRPRVIRYPGKKTFSGGMKSTSDIIRRICEGSYCREHPS